MISILYIMTFSVDVNKRVINEHVIMRRVIRFSRDLVIETVAEMGS